MLFQCRWKSTAITSAQAILLVAAMAGIFSVNCLLRGAANRLDLPWLSLGAAPLSLAFPEIVIQLQQVSAKVPDTNIYMINRKEYNRCDI